MTPDDPRHGTYDVRTARNRKVAAQYRKRRALAELRGIPTAPIPAAPLRTHVNALIGLGWGTPAILAAARVDGTPTALLLIANGRSLRAERKFEPILRLPVTLNCPSHVPDHMLVPSLGATRRVRALMALGWRHEDITAMIGGRSSHHLSAHRHKTINAHDWRLVDAAYEAMSGTPGPSEKSRRRAAKQGFVPPLAWVDIDDPSEERTASEARPNGRAGLDLVRVSEVLDGGWRLATTPKEKAEVVRRWTQQGRPLAELERLTGWNANRYREGEVA